MSELRLLAKKNDFIIPRILQIKMKDYYDIKNWNDKPYMFYKYISDKKKSPNAKILSLEIDVVRLYALLKNFISTKPNGFYTELQTGMPLDNPFWWDFVLESDKGFIQIWRTSARLETLCVVEDKEFDLRKFFELNINRYKDKINNSIKSFEKHIVLINHYKSYKDCVEYLWKEVSALDLAPPKSPDSHVIKELDLKYFKRKIDLFSKNSIKFHTLGKSLLLNTAFQIDSFINLIIRIGASQDLKDHPDILNRHLNSPFRERLKNLKFYSIILTQEIDLEHECVKEAFDLMTLRNKYVHFDSNSIHNKLGEIYFDETFPLHPVLKDAPSINTIYNIFHNPTYKAVCQAYNAGVKIIEYISSLLDSNYKESVLLIIDQNPIGFNETRKLYSMIYSASSIDFYMTTKK
jgi:hypothetical protein